MITGADFLATSIVKATGMTHQSARLAAENMLTAPTARESALIECLYRGYKTLGFDTDGDRSGAEMLSRMGLGGGNLDAFIRLMDRSFVEHRKDYDEACGIG